MKRLLVCFACIALFFVAAGESKGAEFPIGEILQAIPKATPANKEESSGRDGRQTQTQEPQSKEKTGQEGEQAQDVKEVSVAPGRQGNSTKGKPSPAQTEPAKAPQAPLTLEQFKAKEKEYIAGKIKRDAFIKLCDKTLAEAEDAKHAGMIKYVLMTRADGLWESGRKKAAHADADRLIADYPHSPEGYCTKAILCEYEGNVQGFTEYSTKLAGFIKDEEKKKALLQHIKNFPLIQNAITPDALWNAFNENEATADGQYKGKTISIKGKISEITTSDTGYPQLTFSIDQYGMNTVGCAFSKGARSAIAKLKKGQEVIIAGKCLGMAMKSVSLRNCKIVQ